MTKENEDPKVNANANESVNDPATGNPSIDKDKEAKIRSEERDKYIKEIESQKTKISDLTKSLEKKDTEQVETIESLKTKLNELNTSYETTISDYKKNSIDLTVQTALAKIKADQSIDIPVEFVTGITIESSSEDIAASVAKALEKTKTFLQTNGKVKFDKVPPSEVDKSDGSGKPSLDNYTSSKELEKDLGKFIPSK